MMKAIVKGFGFDCQIPIPMMIAQIIALIQNINKFNNSASISVSLKAYRFHL